MKRLIALSAVGVAATGALLLGSTATASAAYPDGWSGACQGDDWVIWDGHGNKYTVHGKCA